MNQCLRLRNKDFFCTFQIKDIIKDEIKDIQKN
jgi:hypothetical protein